jgi:hypothetical protein
MATHRRFAPHAVLLLAVVLALGAGFALAAALPLPDGPNDFNSPGFVIRHAWLKFAYLGDPFRRELSEQEKDTRVARYFELNSDIAGLEREAGDPANAAPMVAADERRLAALRDERAAIENSVAVILEGRLTKVIREAGLTRRFGADVVWPPANIAFQDPPEVLVTSPRSTIRIESESLLQGDLSIEKVQSVERKAESDGTTSAAVIEISGIAMYPAIIPRSGDYEGTMEDIAHEWMHHYLYFTPLGRRYFESGALRTLNETVANIVGRELGDRLAKEYPLPKQAAPSPAPSPAPTPAAPKVDFNQTMHDLRLRVDALLAQGKIDAAERDMAQTRQFLADNGYYLRVINQAFFAFQGSYADTPASSDPIGPKLAQLRSDNATLMSFVHVAQEITSTADLDRALASAR